MLLQRTLLLKFEHKVTLIQNCQKLIQIKLMLIIVTEEFNEKVE